MAGRKPLGPALAEHLKGSAIAKARLQCILQTIAGQLTIDQACSLLGLHQAMFYKLRTRVLQVCLADLEPKPSGRPPQVATVEGQRYAELTADNALSQRELAAQKVRLELAQVLPHLGPSPATTTPKKTPRPPSSQRKQKRRR